jgi:hypothetical protein
MGVRQLYLEYLEDKGVFSFANNRILDIGAQNAYLFTVEYVLAFLARHVASVTDHLEMAKAISEGGRFDPNVNGFTNDAFLGDLFRLANLSYTSLDVFERPGNIVADLNEFKAPSSMHGSFTAVLNFGTTEHVFDQRNCFEVIHDCAAVDGYMFHQVPAIGCVDHSFFVYSPIFFASVAQANAYELIDLWFSGPYGSNKIYDTLKNSLYAELMQNGGSIRDLSLPDNYVQSWDDIGIPDGTINVLMRKKLDRPFRLPFELSTAVAPSALQQTAEDATHVDLANIPDEQLMEELTKRAEARRQQLPNEFSLPLDASL